MKKVTIVCLVDDQEQSLVELRRLGSVHVVPASEVPVSSTRLEELRREAAELGQLLFYLQGLKVKPAESATTPDGETLRHECVQALSRLRQLTERQNALEAEIARLEPWGQFDSKCLRRLEDQGWHAVLVVHPQPPKGTDWLAQFGTEETDGEPIHEFVVARQNSLVYSMLVSRRDLSELSLPVANFPEGSDLGALRRERHALHQECENCRQLLQNHAAQDLTALQQEARRLENEIRFEQTRDGMGAAGARLAYLQGYLPEKQLDELRAQVRKNGWAIRYEEVTADDPQVPTKLRLPKAFGMAETLLDFIGVLPGYSEVDVSVSVLIFLSLFCGLLVGDAGYGLIFTALAGFFLTKAIRRRDEALQQTMKLLLGMSLCTLVWGMLTGNWFGLTHGGLEWFHDDGSHTQLFCFFLAAVHMSLAHWWKMLLAKRWRERLGNFGWGLFLWANFFTVKCLLIDHSFANFTFPTYLYAIGGTLILTCGINWTNAGDVIYAPFTFINSLSDILSYIRLYAVGLSSVYIAQAFNQMGAMIWHANRLLLPFGLLVILAGHLLNVAMAMMSVLVHGIRLNTLEFSGHIGVEWGGRPYRPFRED